MAKKFGSEALAKAKNAAKRARDKAKTENSSLTRKAAMLGSAYGAGRQESYLDRASVGPLSGEIVIGGLAMLIGSKAGGMMGSAAEGVGDAMLSIASFKAGRRAAGETAGETAGAAGEDELPDLERELRRIEAKTAGGDSAEDLDWADAAEAAGWSPDGATAGGDSPDDLDWADAAEAAGWAPQSTEPVDADYEEVLE